MNRNWIIGALIIGGILFFKYGFKPSDPSPPQAALPNRPAVSKEKEKSPALSAAQDVKDPQPAPTVSQLVDSEDAPEASAKNPPKGSVPFELKNGLVIAFGDVLLGKPSHDAFPEAGFIEAPKLFPWVGKEIAYSVHPDLPNPERIQRAIEYFNSNTPVHFVPLTNQTDSIVFSPSEIPLCLSYVGKIGGHQPIFLDDRCGDQEILHEIMHALGFIHEQSRPDRDSFVKINWDRIEPDKQGQFAAVPPSMKGPHIGRPFDYNSAMLYDSSAFAKSRGDITLESITGQSIAPSTMGLSEEDLNRLILTFGR